MTGSLIASAPIVGQLGPDWMNVGIGDFNGDGKADVLFRRTAGTLLMLLMNEKQVLPAATVALASPGVVGIGDFDGDGKADILLRQSDGSVEILLMNGAQIKSAPVVGTLGTD